MKQNDDVSVEIETDHPPYSFHGKWKYETDRYVIIEGTVGDNIGKTLYINRDKIKVITNLTQKRRRDEE